MSENIKEMPRMKALLNGPSPFPNPAPDHELAVKVLKHQLRNIEHVLLAKVEAWEKEAAELESEPACKELAQGGEWEKLAENYGKAAALREKAADLRGYVDTWAEP